ncbi:apoptosis-resistant E3 ubiquitin protein ligase 1-like isoform X2 [Gigantopelta aegis]|uniref:apoptosis-resistant E3 ubiquitin protein ligase 1-like isoform X2 n=1 Tax=Gigantopelta aegis TaxID=1735272 RepID=UPI001B88BCB8|nr:apoptosis-resistant E3 ubiquitin protein ligase 1-like isoform X2 [Gigantopelta aegis]
MSMPVWVIFSLIVGYLTSFYYVSYLRTTFTNQKAECNKRVDAWLTGNGLTKILTTKALTDAGIDCLEDVAVLDDDKYSTLFQGLSLKQKKCVNSAVRVLKDEKILECWLYKNGFSDCQTLLKKFNLNTLDDVRGVSEKTLNQLSGDKSVSHSCDSVRSVVDVLKQQQESGGELVSDNSLRDYLHLKSIALSKYDSRYFYYLAALGFCLLIMIVAESPSMYQEWTVQTINWCHQRGFPDSKTAIFDFFTGRYLAPQCCTVGWEWEEFTTVGKTVAFTIRFYQKNWKPYPISNADSVLVEIMHQGVKVATTMEYGSVEPTNANLARVSFTVHKSGEYKISVMIGARHIKGSPFSKFFEPGPIDASKTGFMNYSSTVVCMAGASHPLQIETRDSFGNLAAYKTDLNNYFKISIRESGSNIKYVPATQIIYDPNEKRLTMYITMERAGCYHAKVSYGDVKLKNGDFDIVVLSPNEMAHVHKNLAKKNHNVSYEARLISCNHERLEKPKKVFVYISPKQLTLKEFYLKIIGKKLYTFRVCPSTKFIFNGLNNQYDTSTFTIDDGAQPPIVLAAKDGNIIAATFTSYLLKNIGGSETFQDKQIFFNHQLTQLHLKRAHSRLPIKIDRSNLLYNSYKITKHFDLSDWCKRFEITFLDEPGLDWGGLLREWFELLCSELFDPSCSGLFMRFSDDSQGLVHPNPKRNPEMKLKYYEFAGKIVGKCLYETSLSSTYRQLVKARFSRSFLAQLIGLRVNYKYFETDDPEFYKSKIKFIEGNDIDDMELTFSEEEYSPSGHLIKVVDLIPNGSRVPVTNRNKLRYLDLLAQYRLTSSVKDEVEAFLKGLNELIPDNLLSIFDENELELLMCGTGNYSIADFKMHHTVIGASLTFTKVLDWFWTIVASFTEEQMARLLQFTTGCSQLPPGGFSELNPKIQISYSPTYNALPTAHTCFNQLCLPDYESIEQFHSALLLAINEGNQGFGLV